MQQLRVPESTSILCNARDGLNLSALGMVSPPEAGEYKTKPYLYALKLQAGAKHPL